jgi:GH18 family chitinase
VTAATGEWIETSMKSADVGPYNAALAQLDFVNNMVYSNLADATSGMQYYVQNGLSAGKLTLGVPFFGSAVDSKGKETDEPEYAQILSAYPDAWQSDSVSGGSLDDGEQITYVGEATMAKETLLGQQYGGIMIWELTGDAPAPHSLLSVIQNNL